MSRGRAFHYRIVGAKLDIKEYFLTGTAAELTKIVTKCCDDTTEENIITQVCEALLQNQFVADGNCIYEVTRGAGMGLNYAGELADLALCILCEPCALTMHPRAFRSRSLMYYRRFKDDVLVIFDESATWKGWLKTLIRNALPYVIKAEAVSSTSLSFLDVTVHLHNDASSSRISTAPYSKPSASKIPLAVDSGHAPNVHFAWPRSEIKRIRRQCGTAAMFEHHRSLMRSTFVRAGAPTVYIDSIFEERWPSSTDIQRKVVIPIWLVVPYEPIFNEAIKSAVREANAKGFLLNLAYGGSTPVVKLSYRKHFKPIATLLTELTR